MSDTTQPTETISYSVYAAAKVINARLRVEGIDGTVPPQMMYNYVTARIRKGKAPAGGLVATVVTDDKGDEHYHVTAESLAKWLDRYVAKKRFNASLDAMG